MRKTQVHWYVNDFVTREVYQTAVVMNKDKDFRLEYTNTNYFPISTNDRDIAEAVLEWAVMATGERYGLLEYSSNKTAKIEAVRNYPNLEVKPIDNQLNEARNGHQKTLQNVLGLSERM